MNALVKKIPLTVILGMLTACASYPQQTYYGSYPAYRRNYVVERNYYPAPVYNGGYAIQRNFYGYGGIPHYNYPAYRPYGGVYYRPNYPLPQWRHDDWRPHEHEEHEHHDEHHHDDHHIPLPPNTAPRNFFRPQDRLNRAPSRHYGH